MVSRASASEKRRLRSVSLAIVGLTFAGGAWLAMAWLMQRFQAQRCPGNTFFWASNQIPTALQIVPLCFPALGLGFLAANRLFAVLPARPGRSFRSKAPGANGAREQGQMIKATSILLLVTLPVSFAASLCQFCLEPQGILYQATPWSGLRYYGWDDVSSVTATCRYDSGRYAGWRKQYLLTLRDGSALDLMTWPGAAVRAFSAVAGALRGQGLSYDATGVAPGCPQPFLGMFVRRP